MCLVMGQRRKDCRAANSWVRSLYTAQHAVLQVWYPMAACAKAAGIGALDMPALFFARLPPYEPETLRTRRSISMFRSLR